MNLRINKLKRHQFMRREERRYSPLPMLVCQAAQQRQPLALLPMKRRRPKMRHSLRLRHSTLDVECFFQKNYR